MMKRPKYNNKKVVIDDIKFDSKMEGDFYIYLKQLKADGQVVDFILQPSFTLQDGFVRYDGKKILPIKYKADFHVFYADGTDDVIDIKGQLTAEFKLKRKMFWKRFERELLCLQYSKKYGERWLRIEELEELRKQNRRK